MLELEGLHKSFRSAGDTAPSLLFEAVSLRLAPGDCVAVMGESGVGKSTLLNCIAGLESLDGGTMRLNGHDLRALGEDDFARLRRRHYGFVFQAFHVLPHLSVLHNVALPLWLLEVNRRDADLRARAMLARVGLSGRVDDWPRTLSGGELQRVAIARALVHGPGLVLADEPTGNLDPERAREVLDVLLGEIRAAGAIGLVVTHSLAAAARIGRCLRLTRDGLHEDRADDRGVRRS
ncbi:MAG: ABC transporter ATP-binding protein [Rhodocyclaceae bacterium]